MSTQTKLVLFGLFVLVVVFLLAQLGALPNFHFYDLINNAVATLPPVQ